MSLCSSREVVLGKIVHPTSTHHLITFFTGPFVLDFTHHYRLWNFFGFTVWALRKFKDSEWAWLCCITSQVGPEVAENQWFDLQIWDANEHLNSPLAAGRLRVFHRLDVRSLDFNQLVKGLHYIMVEERDIIAQRHRSVLDAGLLFNLHCELVNGINEEHKFYE